MARPKGSKNVITKDMREQIHWAFNKVNKNGAFLLDLAANDKPLFVQLVAKVIPNEVKLDIAHTIDLSAAMLQAGERIKQLEQDNNVNLLDITPETSEIVSDDTKAKVSSED